METQAGTQELEYVQINGTLWENGVMATPAELLQMTDEELKAYIPKTSQHWRGVNEKIL
jgi:hypothetical protein